MESGGSSSVEKVNAAAGKRITGNGMRIITIINPSMYHYPVPFARLGMRGKKKNPLAKLFASGFPETDE